MGRAVVRSGIGGQKSWAEGSKSQRVVDLMDLERSGLIVLPDRMALVQVTCRLIGLCRPPDIYRVVIVSPIRPEPSRAW